MTKQPLWTRQQINDELALWDARPLTKLEWTDVRYELEHFRADEVAQQVIAWRRRRQLLKGEPQPQVDAATDVARFTRARSLLNVAAADEQPVVQSFRVDVLGGHLLKLERVADWVAKQRALEGAPTQHVTVAVPADWQPGDPLTFDPNNHSVRVDMLDYGAADAEWVHRVPVATGGVLDRLRLLSTHLAAQCQWQPAQASVYVLTGLTPVVSMLRVGTSVGSSALRVTIDADPDVPSEIVTAAFKRARAALLGPRARRPFGRGIELVVHATERPGLDNRALWHQWNRAHPDEQYETPRAFRQALRDATRRVEARSWPHGVGSK